MQYEIPKFITHYSRGEPFLSITSVSPEKRPEVVKNLNELNAWGINRFLDQEYLARRLELEDTLRKEFIAKGGKPQLSSPIYFFLGRHVEFEEHPLNKGYIVDLQDVPSNSVSFTYGDSLLAYFTDYRELSGERYKNSLCAKVFKIEELENLFAHSEFPKNGALHIECQLWQVPADKVVKRLIR
jgi:hypothetical protein